MFFKWLHFIAILGSLLQIYSYMHVKYKFILFSINDLHMSPLPRTNKYVIMDENITLLAQLTPALGESDEQNSRLVEHVFWRGATPHLKLISGNTSVDVMFSMELHRDGGLAAWRCHFYRSLLGDELTTVTGGQWSGEVCLSRGSHLLTTHASLTDIRYVAWASWPWGPAVASSTVAPRVGRLRYLEDPCGRDVGLMLGLPAAGQSGALLGTVLANHVTWHDLTKMAAVRAAFGSVPSDLSLISGLLTSSHLLLLTSHGLLVSSEFTSNLTFHRLQLQTDSSSGDLEKNELIHSPSCFTSAEEDETVLLLLRSEARYLVGRPPLARRASWREVRDLVPWPAALAAPAHLQYVWHRDTFFVGQQQGSKYTATVLRRGNQTEGDQRLNQTGEPPQAVSLDGVSQPFVLLCPLTQKVYLIADKLYTSRDGGRSFERDPSSLTLGGVDHCATDLVSRHVCLTDDRQLIVLSAGTDTPEKYPLTDLVSGLSISDTKKSALVLDRTGGVTVYTAGSGGISSHYFNIETGLPQKFVEPCDYYLQLLDEVQHTTMLYLDVHDTVTLQLEARHSFREAEAEAESAGPLIELELSNPDIVHVQRTESMVDNHVRITARVTPRSWRLTGVCALTFRLPHASAACPSTSQLVNLALVPRKQRHVAVAMPPGRDPQSEEDVMGLVKAGDSAFYELPVNYRPPSFKGLDIPTSDNIYNADPSRPLNEGLVVVHEVSRRTGKFKACAGKPNRTACGCTKEQQFSMHIRDSDCRRYVPSMSWPAKLRLKMVIREPNRPERPLEAPMYILITELNDRKSWKNHILLDADLSLIHLRAVAAEDRQLVDPRRIRLLLTGTGLYHFRVQVVSHASFNRRLHDEFMVYVKPAKLMSHVQNVVYPIVGISIVVAMFIVFEYYHQRYVDAEESEKSDSAEDDKID